MGQTHRTFHRQTQPTHHLLNFHPPLTLSSRPEARFLRRSGEIPALAFSQPTSTSVISTGAQRSGETPVLALAHPTPKRCHLDRRRAFAPQRRDPYVLFSSNHRNPCHFDRSVAQWRNPRIGSRSPHPKTLSSRPKARFCAAVERSPHWLSLIPAISSWISSKPHPDPKRCHLDRRRAFAPQRRDPYVLFSSNHRNPCHFDRSVAQWRNPRIGSPSPRQNPVGISSKPTPPQTPSSRLPTLSSRPKARFCAAVERPPHWLFPNPPPPLSFRPERSAVEKPPNLFSLIPPNLCHLDRRRVLYQRGAQPLVPDHPKPEG